MVVIDHKAFPRDMEAVVGRSEEVFAQLAAYTRALATTGLPVVAYQHNPILGHIRRCRLSAS